VADGRRVRALIEPTASVRNLAGLPASQVEHVTVDVCDYEKMARALDGCATYYHLAAVYKVWTPDPTRIYRVNVEGTTTSLLAAQAASVRRIVYTSSIAAVGLRADGIPSDETVEFNLFDVANEYILTKMLSGRITLVADRLPIVVVNPALPSARRRRADADRRDHPQPAPGQVPGVTPGLLRDDVDDVAASTWPPGRRGASAAVHPRRPQRHRPHLCEIVAEVAGIKAPARAGWLGRGVALGFELWSDYVTHESLE
jgi:dihydroflavonol-4-reductase